MFFSQNELLDLHMYKFEFRLSMEISLLGLYNPKKGEKAECQSPLTASETDWGQPEMMNEDSSFFASKLKPLLTTSLISLALCSCQSKFVEPELKEVPLSLSPSESSKLIEYTQIAESILADMNKSGFKIAGLFGELNSNTDFKELFGDTHPYSLQLFIANRLPVTHLKILKSASFRFQTFIENKNPSKENEFTCDKTLLEVLMSKENSSGLPTEDQYEIFAIPTQCPPPNLLASMGAVFIRKKQNQISIFLVEVGKYLDIPQCDIKLQSNGQLADLECQNLDLIPTSENAKAKLETMRVRFFPNFSANLSIGTYNRSNSVEKNFLVTLDRFLQLSIKESSEKFKEDPLSAPKVEIGAPQKWLNTIETEAPDLFKLLKNPSITGAIE